MIALREAVARAIFEKFYSARWEDASDFRRGIGMGLSDAALAIVRAALCDPTPEMIRAGAKAWTEQGTFQAGLIAAIKEALTDG